MLNHLSDPKSHSQCSEMYNMKIKNLQNSPLEGRGRGLNGIRKIFWNAFELNCKLPWDVMLGVFPLEGLSEHAVAVTETCFWFAMHHYVSLVVSLLQRATFITNVSLLLLIGIEF